MAFKDIWIPQDETMDANPDIPNMLADAIIQNETDIKSFKDNGGGSGGSELFVIQWNGVKGDKPYQEVSQAIAERKTPVLYQGDKCIATFNGMIAGNTISFTNFDILGISEVIEYLLYEWDLWYVVQSSIVNSNNLGYYISADNGTFKTAVLNCFPDADTMRFPLENSVSEVSAE